MSLIPYETMKEISSSFLRCVPEHWTVAKAKRFFTVRSGDMISSAEEKTEGYPIVGGNGIRGYTTKSNTPGDTVVIGRVGAQCGCVHHIQEEFWASEHAFCVEKKQASCNRFLYYLLTAVNLNQFAIKTAQPLLNTTIVEVQELPFPPLLEQRSIAAFLDAETSKIDALVAEQRRLIELLKEKRQAVISHAVTKGLNPHVKMKPSGIDWLGDVPEHWEVVPLKHLVSMPIIDGPHESPQKRDEGVPFVSAEAISKGILDFDKKWGYISIEDHKRYSLRYSPKRGDILLVKLGATAGIPAIVDSDIDFNIWVPLAAIRLKPNVQSRFIFHVLRSSNLTMAYELNWTFGTQQTLGLRTISNLQMPLPPWEEQLGIVNRLDPLLLSIESLIAEAQMAISLLQERRTALISAAVTGKIDVRGFVPKEAST